jgi:hypothetical protein
MASFQEMPYTLRDVKIDFSIRRGAGAVGKVCRPTSQVLVEAVAHFLPTSYVSGYQQVAHLLLDALPALLGWTGSKIPMTIRL